MKCILTKLECEIDNNNLPLFEEILFEQKYVFTAVPYGLILNSTIEANTKFKINIVTEPDINSKIKVVLRDNLNNVLTATVGDFTGTGFSLGKGTYIGICSSPISIVRVETLGNFTSATVTITAFK